MECPKCGSRNCQAISEYLELKKAPFKGWLFFLVIISVLAIFVGTYLIVSGISRFPVDETNVVAAADSLLEQKIGKHILASGIILNILLSIAKLLQPHRHQTKTKIICIDCGTTVFEELVIPEEPETFVTNSNKTDKK